ASKRFQQNYLMALEQLATLQHLNIRFSDIRPGWIRTPLLNDDEHYTMLMNPDYALPKILRSFMRRRRVAVIDWRWNLVVGLWRLIPNSIWVRLPIIPGRLK
ncbi:MAG: oxidoreductase, partial [Duncaniella sp.]|nr:oxidoreductase [Duncaniella sp.]